MRALLDIYVRSLTEREPDADAPEHLQDLGTFVCWLLERQGFDIHLRSYWRRGTAHRQSKGRLQHGVDIVASKPDEDPDRVWLFVLKKGDFVNADYAPGTPGTMIHDLWLAAGRAPSANSQHVPSYRGNFAHVTVVAVHNGDVDTEAIGGQIDSQRRMIEQQCGVTVELWQAKDLVAMALAPPADPSLGGLESHADASLFPPAVRPFARLALDSLQRDPDGLGATFDLAAVDQLIERVLPLGRAPESNWRAPLPEGELFAEKAPARHLHRAAAELALFAEMVAVECRRVADDNTLPALDTLARVTCRIVEHLRRVPKEQLPGFKDKFRKLLHALVDRYIGRAERLLDRLDPLLDTPYSLALPTDSEILDYPLRTLRLAGHLAIAGLACLDRDKKTTGRAERFADALARLARSNEGGILSPITDDHIIELGAMWLLWLRTGRHDDAAHTATRLIQRLVIRRQTGRPLPALWQSARVPMDHGHVGTLVAAHIAGPAMVPGFVDSGSTILPLAVTLCARAGLPVSDALLMHFGPEARDEDDRELAPPARAVYPQSWQPPDDAASEWYAREIRHRGVTSVYDLTEGAAALVSAFEAHHGTATPASPARDWKLPVIDWMAWSVLRTPPPMSLFLQPALWPSRA